MRRTVLASAPQRSRNTILCFVTLLQRWRTNCRYRFFGFFTRCPVPCLIVLLAIAIPRVVLVALWLLTNWFEGLFNSLLWPILGFLFLPTTLFWYTAVQHWFGGVWTLWPILGLIVALLIDTSPSRGAMRRR